MTACGASRVASHPNFPLPLPGCRFGSEQDCSVKFLHLLLFWGNSAAFSSQMHAKHSSVAWIPFLPATTILTAATSLWPTLDRLSLFLRIRMQRGHADAGRASTSDHADAPRFFITCSRLLPQFLLTRNLEDDRRELDGTPWLMADEGGARGPRMISDQVRSSHPSLESRDQDLVPFKHPSLE